MRDHIYFEYDKHPVSLKQLKLMVNDEVILTTLDHMLEIVGDELSDIRCPVHDKHVKITISVSEAGDLNVHTDTCCSAFAKTATQPILTTFHRTAYFSPGMKLLLMPEGASLPLTYEVDHIQQLVLGRSDYETDDDPDIDLCPYGAMQHGVSRKHATITWMRGALHIIDENSRNGTFVNGEQLEAHQAHVLRDEDHIQLGGLDLRVMLLGGAN